MTPRKVNAERLRFWLGTAVLASSFLFVMMFATGLQLDEYDVGGIILAGFVVFLGLVIA